ncbi:MAG TPA: biotin/lipoyl-binding protein [Gemmataceae bacterium]|jgi:multidrug resistance efflux pump|nr:biotin/lipoyl-binding protein [Gemmataceae bacterium]
MIAFLLIVYTAVVLVLFKLKLVKPRPYPIAWTIVAGVLMIGGVVVAWMLCAPLSPKAVTTQYVIQLVPYVKGQVKKVYAQANQPLKKGDLLLEIEPEPYQNTVNQVQAQLQAAKETVNQAQAGVQVADAGVLKARDGVAQAQAALAQAKAAVTSAQANLNKVRAQDDLAKTQEEIAVNLQRTDAGAISALKVAEAIQNRVAADAAVNQAAAGVTQAVSSELQAEAGLAGARSAQQQAEAGARQAAFTLKVAESNVPAVQAQLDDARFNLTQCKMLAPADGFVVNWQVQDGTMLVPMPLAAAGTFISTADTAIAAAFPQNYLVNVKPDDDVELVLDPYPGRLFKGKVDTVIQATGEGQFNTSGNIPYAAKIGSFGVLAVKIRLTGEDRATQLPLGAGGTVAIYTDKGKPVHVISKVTIRMKKWLLYVLPSVEKP